MAAAVAMVGQPTFPNPYCYVLAGIYVAKSKANAPKGQLIDDKPLV